VGFELGPKSCQEGTIYDKNVWAQNSTIVTGFMTWNHKNNIS